MNKTNLINYISERHSCTKAEAGKIIDIFTESVIAVLGDSDKEISLVGFGRFYTSEVKAKEGRNPRTGQKLNVPAYIRPKFVAGKKLKDACNTTPNTQ